MLATRISFMNELSRLAERVGADALAVVTEWKEFRTPDFEAIKAALRTPVVFDGRNLYEPAAMAAFGVGVPLHWHGGGGTSAVTVLRRWRGDAGRRSIQCLPHRPRLIAGHGRR